MSKRVKTRISWRQRIHDWVRQTITLECDFQEGGKCRYTGFPKYPPGEYNLACVCCRLMHLEEELKGIFRETKNMAAAWTEVVVLLLKQPTTKTFEEDEGWTWRLAQTFEEKLKRLKLKIENATWHADDEVFHEILELIKLLPKRVKGVGEP